jgi:hypothetical protein
LSVYVATSHISRIGGFGWADIPRRRVVVPEEDLGRAEYLKRIPAAGYDSGSFGKENLWGVQSFSRSC